MATLPAHLSIYSIGIVALGCSLMWPAIWPLAMKDLGKFTKTGSSLLTMGLFGGAILTLLFGWFKDLFGAQNAYWLCLPCYALKALSLRPKSIAISMQKHCLFYPPKLHSIRNLFRFIL